MTQDDWILILQVVNLVVITVSVLLLFLQIRKQHDWNRRKASQDLLQEMVTGDLLNLRRVLEGKYGLDIISGQPDFDDFINQKGDAGKSEILFAVRSMFNFMEAVSVGIKNAVIEEEVVYDYMSLILVRYWDWAEDYVKELQSEHPTTWIEWEYYGQRWRKRLDAAEKRMQSERQNLRGRDRERTA